VSTAPTQEETIAALTRKVDQLSASLMVALDLIERLAEGESSWSITGTAAVADVMIEASMFPSSLGEATRTTDRFRKRVGEARRVEWEGDFPADLRRIVEEVFQPVEFMLPTWCQTVVLRHAPSLDSTLQIELSIRNRWALVKVGPDWFSGPYAERENRLFTNSVTPLWSHISGRSQMR
jgi:hypothetical protein